MTFVSYNVLFFLERLNAPPRHSIPSDQANRRYHNHGSWVPVALLVRSEREDGAERGGTSPLFQNSVPLKCGFCNENPIRLEQLGLFPGKEKPK